MKLAARRFTFEFPRRPLVMGIVNLGADSFSGDGTVDISRALLKARQLVADGADMIDIGAESARTNREAISEEEESAQLIRFIKQWDVHIPLSINTWRPAVAREVMLVGGDILNDIGALPTDENARICAKHGAALLIMHTLGEPKVPHTHVVHEDIMTGLETFFAQKIAVATAAGMNKESLILDPGIDFAKQRDDNLRIYRELARLHQFECPILLPISRKTVIGDVLNISAPERDAGTMACLVQGMLQGAQIFRVHNVRAAVQSIRMIEAVEAGVRNNHS